MSGNEEHLLIFREEQLPLVVCGVNEEELVINRGVEEVRLESNLLHGDVQDVEYGNRYTMKRIDWN